MTHDIRWTIEKITQRLALITPVVYRRRAPLPLFRYIALASADDPPLIAHDVDDRDWAIIEPYSHWGAWAKNFMLRSHFCIPTDWDAAPIALFLPLGDAGEFTHPEALVYVDGKPYAACDRYHQEVPLAAQWHDGHTHRLALHGWTGAGIWQGNEPGAHLMMRPCEIVQIDQPTRDFVATARVALQTAQSLDATNPTRGRLLHALDAAFVLLDTREPFGDAFYESVPAAHTRLRFGIEQAGAPLSVQVVGTGHAHIDVAWLWTLSQTRRKASRTFHTVLRLMEQFPEYHFTQSQPQLYDYIRRDHPDLFGAITERVAEGRWEPIGGMWVEADCNLSGAEALARQFVLGRQFFEQHFGAGVESPVLWLPDVFGYAWALPQLIKQAELDYFFTIKIGWSQYNRLPYDSFWWQGLDGTRVLTHFSPTPEPGSAYASTYNALARPADVLGTWHNYKQKEGGNGAADPLLLMAFGYGDGGGGPTREMLENLHEMRTFPGLPQVRQSPVGTFFRELEATAGAQLPVWNGELYLEYHRGTYTTQSRTKRANRRIEFLLHDAEFLATLAALLDPHYTYPHAQLRSAWELVCLNQFHDIIPGSSIGPVYMDSAQQYAQIRAAGEEVCADALKQIATHVAGDMLVTNPTSFCRTDLAFWPGSLPRGYVLRRAAPDKRDEPVYTQATRGGTWIASKGYAPYSVTGFVMVRGDVAPPSTSLIATPTLLENTLLRVEFNAAGDITRIYDKQAQREVLAPDGIANQFQAFEDRPLNWDAWDIDIFYDDKSWFADPATSVTVVEGGPLRATLEVRRRILHSTYTQRISLIEGSPALHVETTIDWRERHVLLKVAFPVNILAPTATYEIQWGNVERPTHRNTSWDWARFETCAQKWVDLSEGDYGVSLLNDCKYGHDIHDQVIRLSLLRSPTSPDPEADQGEHHFAYTLLPHAGRWDERTIAAAYALNDPLRVYESQADAPSAPTPSGAATTIQAGVPLIRCDRPNLVIETIKWAEDGNGFVVRLYESQRKRGPVTLYTSCSLRSATKTNVHERDETALDVDDHAITLTVRPYEIVTLRIVPA